MSGLSLTSGGGGGIKVRIKRSLSALKGKENSYGGLFTDGEGRLWVRDPQLGSLVEVFGNPSWESLSDIPPAIADVFNLVKKPNRIVDTRSVAAAENYAANDVVSDSATAAEAHAWSFKVNKTSGVIEKVLVTCETTALTPRLTLQFYSGQPNCTLTDNVANTGCVLKDKTIYEGFVDMPSMRDLGTGMSESIATANSPASNLPLPYFAPENMLYVVLITRDAITGEAAGMDITITLQIRED